MRGHQLGHLYNGKLQRFPCIIISTYSIAPVSSTPGANINKNMATAVLLLREPILRSMAKRHLSLYACIIPHSSLWLQEIQATDKVSLFARKGDFLLCHHPP